MKEIININDYDYPLPEDRIAKYPLPVRDSSRLLVYRDGKIEDRQFGDIASEVSAGSLLVFNNTRVVRARLLMHKPTGARIEIFCLEPYKPADYERSLSACGQVVWKCMVGNSKKWKEGPLSITFRHNETNIELVAEKIGTADGSTLVKFDWNGEISFGQLLEALGRIPIPPYLGRESEAIDEERYQTVYSVVEGSVAAPTAGLHFSEGILSELARYGIQTARVTLHVGAGTFLPVKSEDVRHHTMHTEHFTVDLPTVRKLISNYGNITAVGTTTVRTLESLIALSHRILVKGDPDVRTPVDQWELYSIPDDTDGKYMLCLLEQWMILNDTECLHAATSIMIVPGFCFRIVDAMVTNFHQPRSTLLLLVSAFVVGDWKLIYDHALASEYRFLSYGDSSLLFRR